LARVLVVDDAAFMRRVLRDLLEGEGHTVVAEAATGEAAVEKFREHRPDLVTLDLVMPGAGGRHALKGILGIEPTARILVVSAVGQKREVDEAMDLGATDFLLKPFDKEAVLSTVARLVSNTVDTRG
jgi:two-component system, chemotaxis family, chemotaxis protein CheY